VIVAVAEVVVTEIVVEVADVVESVEREEVAVSVEVPDEIEDVDVVDVVVVVSRSVLVVSVEFVVSAVDVAVDPTEVVVFIGVEDAVEASEEFVRVEDTVKVELSIRWTGAALVAVPSKTIPLTASKRIITNAIRPARALINSEALD
jgi:hypothetical protein